MKNRTLATLALSVLLAGPAFAQAPASGEGPLFLNGARVSTTQSRDVVRAEAVQATRASLVPHRHPSDQASLMTRESKPSVTRAEARAKTREDIAQGIKPAVGERS